VSFDNSYPNRKDHRKRFYGSRAFDRSCRCHGSCPYCRSSRLRKTVKPRTPKQGDEEG